MTRPRLNAPIMRRSQFISLLNITERALANRRDHGALPWPVGPDACFPYSEPPANAFLNYTLLHAVLWCTLGLMPTTRTRAADDLISFLPELAAHCDDAGAIDTRIAVVKHAILGERASLYIDGLPPAHIASAYCVTDINLPDIAAHFQALYAETRTGRNRKAAAA